MKEDILRGRANKDSGFMLIDMKHRKKFRPNASLETFRKNCRATRFGILQLLGKGSPYVNNMEVPEYRPAERFRVSACFLKRGQRVGFVHKSKGIPSGGLAIGLGTRRGFSQRNRGIYAGAVQDCRTKAF